MTTRKDYMIFFVRFGLYEHASIFFAKSDLTFTRIQPNWQNDIMAISWSDELQPKNTVYVNL